jgi:hypothetical protein
MTARFTAGLATAPVVCCPLAIVRMSAEQQS